MDKRITTIHVVKKAFSSLIPAYQGNRHEANHK